jgi:hypothetical protein
VAELIGKHVDVWTVVGTGPATTPDDPWRTLPVSLVNFLLAKQAEDHANRLLRRRRAVGNAAAVGTMAIVRYFDLRWFEGLYFTPQQTCAGEKM